MRLPLFSSRETDPSPNLVGIQHAALDMLPTVLVCPIKQGEIVTNVRTTLEWQGTQYTVLCDLARPINRNVLRPVGDLDADTSERILETFLRLLAF
jgi:mRNA-degrading endonuclease toxin of MazEF toxin-antitoxin module